VKSVPPPAPNDALFRLVADRLPLLVWISGCDKRTTYFNQAWLDFTGRPLESEIGDGWADGVHPEDLRNCLDSYTSAFDRRVPFIVEYRLRRHDGEYRNVLDNAAPLITPDGSFAGYVGTCVDITEFRHAEAERNLANDRLRLAMAAGRSMGWEWDLHTNGIIWFGDLSTMFGIPANVFAGGVEDFRRSLHPDDRRAVWKALESARESRAPYAAEFRILWPGSALRWVAAKGQFEYSATGQPRRMLGMAWDITERKNAEESLQRKEMELKEAQRLSGVGSWHWDRATGTVTWSEELYRLAARDPTLPAVRYEEHPQLYCGENWHRLQEAVETALQTGAPYELVLEMTSADGTHRWVRARGEVERDVTGYIAGLRGTVQDITERKRAEEALSNVNGRLIEAQEAERARIARELHDDIGQRLALLAMGVAQLTTMSSRGAARPSVESLQKQIAEITADVQALSHDLHPPRLLHLGVAAAMRGLCEEISSQKDASIEFRCEGVVGAVPPDVSLCFYRILQEALNNALRHSGTRHFYVHLGHTGDALELTVRDDGVGFDVDAAGQRLGLGLTSMRERIKLVSGELLITSRATRGTTVRARVSLRQGDDAPATIICA
jgi:PAS domain S-box-containing protein